jgi:hypothetical protein
MEPRVLFVRPGDGHLIPPGEGKQNQEWQFSLYQGLRRRRPTSGYDAPRSELWRSTGRMSALRRRDRCCAPAAVLIGSRDSPHAHSRSSYSLFCYPPSGRTPSRCARQEIRLAGDEPCSSAEDFSPSILLLPWRSRSQARIYTTRIWCSAGRSYSHPRKFHRKIRVAAGLQRRIVAFPICPEDLYRPFATISLVTFSSSMTRGMSNTAYRRL